jgi:hypothetical protein
MEKAGGGITEVREEWLLLFDLEAEVKNWITHQRNIDFLCPHNSQF